MEIEVKTEEELKAAVAGGDVLVDFWATWCGPCQMMGRQIAEALLPQMPGLTVVKVNVDEAPALAAAYGILSIPTLHCYKNGERTAAFVGVTPVADLRAAFA
jgi:thioredoxin 1